MSTTPSPMINSADELVAFLGETTPHIVDWLRRAYQGLGADLINAVVAQTQAIEAAGGMMVKDKSRRRTLGGVFFHVLARKIPPELRAAWPLPKPEPPAPAPFVLEWAQRHAAVAKAAEAPGTARAQISLRGRPRTVTQQGITVVMVLVASGDPPGFPRGVPAPPPVETRFQVFVAESQWHKVAPLLAADPEDELLVDGWCQADPDTGAIAVWAQNISTRNQKATSKGGGRSASSSQSFEVNRGGQKRTVVVEQVRRRRT
jgi:hypothetical protein